MPDPGVPLSFPYSVPGITLSFWTQVRANLRESPCPSGSKGGPLTGNLLAPAWQSAIWNIVVVVVVVVVVIVVVVIVVVVVVVVVVVGVVGVVVVVVVVVVPWVSPWVSL